ncbi:hypothetical protein [Paenibacillus silvae]|uniref:hypothetical protein n=1 Tax=Paenibacillus silvae TaxID=1325358 RepID=UPI0020041B07|nr:hypothetical protein [Paenibacillus silvae]MCK6075984.1 hypothetical protein [Paenibacillus silvae]MCK6150373.1 hypothetical protein [Paenibacillus silvae]MCK6268671.1 hypothetical protein [Paenibacillus silvae]
MSPKLRVLLIVLASCILLVGGCTITYHIKNSNIVKKATPIGVEYFKRVYDVSVEFTDSQVMAEYVRPDVVLYGYVNNDVNERISIAINYNTYEVQYVGGPEWLIKSE